MKPVDVTSNTYIEFGIKNDEKDSELEVDDHIKKLLQKVLRSKLVWKRFRH